QWIIWGANEFKFDGGPTIVKRCHDLIDAPEPEEIYSSKDSSI
ncbi:hypothetical protein NEAUS06_2572, partial [Nematocida ausubeli]